jgi:squalene synthase HpnC
VARVQARRTVAVSGGGGPQLHTEMGDTFESHDLVAEESTLFVHATRDPRGVRAAAADGTSPGSLPAAGRSTAPPLPATRTILARAGSENFPVAMRLLGRATARHLLAIYGFARLVDEIGDAAEGDRLALLDALESDLDAAFRRSASHPLLAFLARSIHELRLPRDPFVRLIDANRRDQSIADYPTFAELVGYCHLSADPVGELVLYVFGVATPERVLLSDRICTALQLIEHWQDVGEDFAAGRVYLPADSRERFGVSREDLAASTTSPALRALLAFEAGRARTLLDEGAPLVRTLGPRAAVAVAGYVGGGRAALRALERSGYDVLPQASRASRPARTAAILGTLRRRA